MPDESPTLLPNDHARMLVELLRLSGGAALMRRWVAALLNVPADEREQTVRAVEERIASEYDMPELSRAATLGESQTVFDISSEPVQRDGYTEVVVRSYAPAKKADDKAEKKKRRKSG